MRTERYRAAAALAGAALLRSRPQPQLVGHVTGNEHNAVYIVCDRTGRVRYVGSTVGRPARKRLAEHLGDVDRTREWHEAWIIPLRESASEAAVRTLEGQVGRFLRPLDSRCLPRRATAQG
jgi:hypothetical protein